MNVLDEQKRQQVLGLGRMGWSLRKIEEATGVRRETASAYLKAAGIAVRKPPQAGPSAKPATAAGVSTDSAAAAAAPAKPASGGMVSTDSGAVIEAPTRAPTAS